MHVDFVTQLHYCFKSLFIFVLCLCLSWCPLPLTFTLQLLSRSINTPMLVLWFYREMIERKFITNFAMCFFRQRYIKMSKCGRTKRGNTWSKDAWVCRWCLFFRFLTKFRRHCLSISRNTLSRSHILISFLIIYQRTDTDAVHIATNKLILKKNCNSCQTVHYICRSGGKTSYLR